MPSIVRAQVSIPRNTGIPEDVVVNTFHFCLNASDGEAFLDACEDRLNAAYTRWRNVLGNNAVLTAAQYRFYDLSDPEPRVPLRTSFMTGVTNPTDDPLPSECAAVVSWTADPVSGVPAARLRGRTYIGPLDRSTQNASDRDRIDSSALDELVAGGQALMAHTGFGTGEGLAVFSRVDDDCRLVTGGHVDNAYDTQRRRGKDATLRFSL